MHRIIAFLQESRGEFKRVSWPSRDKVIRLTSAVLAIIAVVAALIGILDYLFNLGVGWLMGR